MDTDPNDYHAASQDRRVSGLRAEVERLRKALTAIEDASRGSHADWHAHGMLLRCNQLAVGALRP